MEPDQISSVEADWSGSTLFVWSLFLVDFDDISADNMGSRLFAGTVRVKFFKGEVINTSKIRPHAVYMCCYGIPRCLWTNLRRATNF